MSSVVRVEGARSYETRREPRYAGKNTRGSSVASGRKSLPGSRARLEGIRVRRDGRRRPDPKAANTAPPAAPR
jgi:hypothetical protein